MTVHVRDFYCSCRPSSDVCFFTAILNYMYERKTTESKNKTRYFKVSCYLYLFVTCDGFGSSILHFWTSVISYY